MTDEYVERWRSERQRLEGYLASQGYKINDIERGLEGDHFSGFIGELAEMGRILEEAELVTTRTRDVYSSMEVCARARIKKDHTYTKLAKALAVQMEYKKINGRDVLTLTAEGTSTFMERIHGEPQIVALRNYITQRFDNGVSRCEKILGGNN